MAELNRREAQRAAIIRIFGQVHGEQFPQWELLELRERLKMLEQAFERYNVEHLNIIENFAEPDALEVHNEAVAQTEENYMETRLIFLNRILELENEQNQHNELVNPPIQQIIPFPERNDRAVIANDVRLERISPEIFYGDYAKWKEWKSMYEGLVHNNLHITDTQKFHYLLRAVGGSAAQILSGWQAIGENYVEAYNSLIAVFDNNYRITMAHLEELHNIPKLDSETHENLRSIVDSTNRVIRQLRVAGSPVEHWDQFIVHGLISKMPPRTLNAWETSQDLVEMPPVDTVVRFLERRARGIINLNSNSNGKGNQSSKSSKVNDKGAVSKRNSNNSGGKNENGNVSSVNGAVCHHCKGAHPLYRCPPFMSLKQEQRRDRVMKLNLCENCFSPHHQTGSEKCRFGTCRSCNRNEYHNSVLCPLKTRTVNVTTVINEPEPSSSMTVARAATNTQSSNFH